MNKYAAQKIAQEYHSLGIKLAFEQAGIKLAEPKAKPKMDKNYRLGEGVERGAVSQAISDAGFSAAPYTASKGDTPQRILKDLAGKHNMSEAAFKSKTKSVGDRMMHFNQGLQRGGDSATAFNLPSSKSPGIRKRK